MKLLAGALLGAATVAAAPFYTEEHVVEGDTALFTLKATASETFDTSTFNDIFTGFSNGAAEVIGASSNTTHLVFRVASDNVPTLSSVTLKSGSGAEESFTISYTPTVLDYGVQASLSFADGPPKMVVDVSFTQEPIWAERLRLSAVLQHQAMSEPLPSDVESVTDQGQLLGSANYNEINATHGTFTYTFGNPTRQGCFRVAVAPTIKDGTKGTVSYAHGCQSTPANALKISSNTVIRGENSGTVEPTVQLASGFNPALMSRLKAKTYLYLETGSNFVSNTSYTEISSSSAVQLDVITLTGSSLGYATTDNLVVSTMYYMTFDDTDNTKSTKVHTTDTNLLRVYELPNKSVKTGQFTTSTLVQHGHTVDVAATPLNVTSEFESGQLYVTSDSGLEESFGASISVGMQTERTGSFQKLQLGGDGANVTVVLRRSSFFFDTPVNDTGDSPSLTIQAAPGKVSNVSVLRKVGSQRHLVVSFTAATDATSHNVTYEMGSSVYNTTLSTGVTTFEFECTEPVCQVTDIIGLSEVYPSGGASLEPSDMAAFETVRGFESAPGPFSLQADNVTGTLSLEVSDGYTVHQDTLEYAGKVATPGSGMPADLVTTGYTSASLVSFTFAEIANAALTIDASAVPEGTFVAHFYGQARSTWTNNESAAMSVAFVVAPVMPVVESYEYNMEGQNATVSYSDSRNVIFRDDVVKVKVNDGAYGDAMPVTGLGDQRSFTFPLTLSVGACANVTFAVDTANGTLTGESEKTEFCALPTPVLSGQWVDRSESTSPAVKMTWQAVPLADSYAVREVVGGTPNLRKGITATSLSYPAASNVYEISVAVEKNGAMGPFSNVVTADLSTVKTVPIKTLELLTPLPLVIGPSSPIPDLTFRAAWDLPTDPMAQLPTTMVLLQKNASLVASCETFPQNATSFNMTVSLNDFPPLTWNVTAMSQYYYQKSGNTVSLQSVMLHVLPPKAGEVVVNVDYKNRQSPGIVSSYDQSLGDGVMSHLTNYETVLVKLVDARCGSTLMTKTHNLSSVLTPAQFNMPFSMQEIYESSGNTTSLHGYEVHVRVENSLTDASTLSSTFEGPQPATEGPQVSARLVYGGRGAMVNATAASSNVALSSMALSLVMGNASLVNHTATFNSNDVNVTQFFVSLAPEECIDTANATQSNLMFESPVSSTNLSVCAPAAPTGSESSLVQVILHLTGVQLPAAGTNAWFDLRDKLRDEIAAFVQAGADTEVRVVKLEAYTESSLLLDVAGGVEVTAQVEGPGAPASLDAFVDACTGTGASPSGSLLSQLECSTDESTLPFVANPQRVEEAPRPTEPAEPTDDGFNNDSGDDADWWIFLIVAGALIVAFFLIYTCFFREGGFSFGSDSDKAHRHAENAAMAELAMQNTEV
ncbi:MAG: hypothetical protein MHM6MM_005212 [Cercozoa sp. M6MM]